MRILSFVAVLFLSILSTGIVWGQDAAPSVTELQTQVAAAQQRLNAAKQAFAEHLDDNADIKAAKKAIEAAKAEVDDARRSGNSQQVAQAASSKLAAQKKLATLMKQLEAADPDVAKASAQLADASEKRKNAVALDSQEKEQAKLAQQKKDNEARDARRAEYNAALHREFNKFKLGGPGTAVGLVGDEVNLVIVKAKPKDYVNVPFIVTGAVKISDYYNFGYSDAKSTHYSFGLTALTKDGESGEHVHVYQKRKMGDDIVDMAAKLEKESPGTSLLVRLKLTISPQFVRTYHEADEVYEVLDWQFSQGGESGKWTPWHSEVIDPPGVDDKAKPQEPASGTLEVVRPSRQPTRKRP